MLMYVCTRTCTFDPVHYNNCNLPFYHSPTIPRTTFTTTLGTVFDQRPDLVHNHSLLATWQIHVRRSSYGKRPAQPPQNQRRVPQRERKGHEHPQQQQFVLGRKPLRQVPIVAVANVVHGVVRVFFQCIEVMVKPVGVPRVLPSFRVPLVLACTGAGLFCAVQVVVGLFFGVFENLIGLVDFLKLCLACGIGGVKIRVCQFGFFKVGTFDQFRGSRTVGQAQRGAVVVLVGVCGKIGTFDQFSGCGTVGQPQRGVVVVLVGGCGKRERWWVGHAGGRWKQTWTNRHVWGQQPS